MEGRGQQAIQGGARHQEKLYLLFSVALPDLCETLLFHMGPKPPVPIALIPPVWHHYKGAPPRLPSVEQQP